MLYRTAEEKINNWITEGKDAFLLTGARQIGKTYLIRHCLKQAQIPYLEINFIERPELVEEGSYRYIMSGSLLGVELNDLRSAPVGYLRVLDMYPLCFEEFCRAVGIRNEIWQKIHD